MPLEYVETVPRPATAVPSVEVQTWRSSLGRSGRGTPKWNGYEINEVAGALETAYPESYTTLARAPEGSPYDYDLVFTSRPPGAVIASVKRLPVKVRIRWGAPLTSAQLLSAQSAVLAELPSLFPGHAPSADLVTSPMSTALGVFIGNVPETAALSQDELSAALTELVADSTGVEGFPVIVELDPAVAPAGAFEVVHGGRSITGCTSGFGAVRPSTGIRGIITAKHCNDRPYYLPSGANVLLNAAIDGPYKRDTQFNGAPTPHTADAKFQSSVGTDYTVVSVANPGYGDYVSKYGKVTGATHGQVTNPNTCYYDERNDKEWCGVFHATFSADYGDSGGPCFAAGGAKGIVSGGRPNAHSTYCTRITDIPDSALILQSPR